MSDSLSSPLSSMSASPAPPSLSLSQASFSPLPLLPPSLYPAALLPPTMRHQHPGGISKYAVPSQLFQFNSLLQILESSGLLTSCLASPPWSLVPLALVRGRGIYQIWDISSTGINNVSRVFPTLTSDPAGGFSDNRKELQSSDRLWSLNRGKWNWKGWT